MGGGDPPDLLCLQPGQTPSWIFGSPENPAPARARAAFQPRRSQDRHKTAPRSHKITSLVQKHAFSRTPTKTNRKPSFLASRWVPKWPEITLRSTQDRPRSPKMAPKASKIPQDGTKRPSRPAKPPQEAAKKPYKAPKRPPCRTKRPPRDPKRPPRGCQDAP